MSRNSTPAARIASTVARMSLVASATCCDARAAVELQELVDLRLLLADGRLVERELHLAGAVGDDLAHQRRVLGGDVVADELGHVGEAHDPLVEGHPLVHPAQLDVADDVVDGLEEALGLQPGRDGGAVHDRAAGHETGQERAAVAGPVDQGVPGVAVRRDRGHPDGAVLVGEVVRLGQPGGALADRVRVGGVDVGHLQRDVGHAVAVLGRGARRRRCRPAPRR